MLKSGNTLFQLFYKVAQVLVTKQKMLFHHKPISQQKYV